MYFCRKYCKKNARTRQGENVLEGHTRSWSRPSFALFYSNCPKQQRIFNRCDQLYIKTIKCGKEIYTDTRAININIMLLIGQLMWIITPGKEEKPNTYTYYKRAKEQLTSGGNYHRILFFCFCSETNTYQ